jgi:hypothetical protein
VCIERNKLEIGAGSFTSFQILYIMYKQSAFPRTTQPNNAPASTLSHQLESKIVLRICGGVEAQLVRLTAELSQYMDR